MKRLSDYIFNAQDYIDGSINNVRATYIPDASLSSDFYWNASNLLKVDVSSAGVSQLYVDGSLLIRDVSISDLYSITNSLEASIVGLNGTYIKEASLGTDFYWDSGYLEVSVGGGTGDVTKVYVDGSLATRDASITVLFNQNNIQDSSITYLTNYVNDLSTNGTSKSYSGLFDGTIDVSLTIPYSTHGITNDSSSLVVAVFEDEDLVMTSINVSRDSAAVKINWISGLMGVNCRYVISG